MYRQLFLITIVFWCLQTTAQSTFTNPLKTSGPDPWAMYKDGLYYYMNTSITDRGENELRLWRTHNMAAVGEAENKIIFDPPAGTLYSKQLWAPEIHFLDGKWYVYFAADSGINLHHRIWVLENENADPFKGEWKLKGKLQTDSGDHWAIDLTVFEHGGKRYATWSGWKNYNNEQQSIYIAEMENPWTMRSERALISEPQYSWELQGKVPVEWQKNTGEPPYLRINEGPQALQNGNKLFIIYSANACWLEYNLGMLTYDGTGSLLDRRNWRKHPQPVFSQVPQEGIYAPGHNSFFKSPDGKEDWILYHANPGPTDGCGAKRAPHMQKIGWNKDGTPNLGRPSRKPMKLPSGTVIK